MATCKVCGTIKDGAEIPVEGLLVIFRPAAFPAVNTSTGDAVAPITLKSITTSSGYFEQYLTVNMDFVVIINGIGMKQKIRVPNEAEKNLFELTAAYTTGDPTPTDGGDGGGDEANW